MGEKDILDTFTDLTDEQKLILITSRRDKVDDLEVIKKKIISDDNINWDMFTGWIINERISGVVYNNILEFDEISDKIIRPLSLLNIANELRNNFQTELNHDISIEFEEENVHYAFLKGSILNTCLYKNGERISNDTDIMVSLSDIAKVTRILETMGYVQGRVECDQIIPATKQEKLFARLNTYEVVPFLKKTDNRFLPIHEIDINFKLSNDGTIDDAERLLNNTIIIECSKNTKLRTLDYNAFLTYLCIHLYRESTMIYKIINGDDIVLYKYMDIHHFIITYRNNIDWNYIFELAKEVNHINDIYYTLYFTETIYPGTIEESVLKKIKPDNVEFLHQYKGRDNSNEVYYWNVTMHFYVFLC